MLLKPSELAPLNQNELVSEDIVCERPDSLYCNNSLRFLNRERSFEKQYASFYIARLNIASPILFERAQKKWGSHISIKKLCELDSNETVIVIGTLFKHMKLHPSILKEISEEHHLIPQPIAQDFVDEEDYLILEDELQHVILKGNIDPHKHVTGVNIAIYGHSEDGGKFFVEDVCYSYLPKPLPLPTLQDDKYVLLLSGLNFGDENAIFHLELLKDFITGYLGNSNDQQEMSSIIRIIIAGNSIHNKPNNSSNKAKFYTRKTKASGVEKVKMLDEFLSNFVELVNIDLMPGEFDPTNHLIPQQPFHPCLFPKSSQHQNFQMVTNPYDATIAGVRFLGSSGQNFKNIRAYSRIEDPIEIMESTLDWGHISPSAPDTLDCYPFMEEDPFIITECPHVYFAGNMPKLKIKDKGGFHKNMLIISLPPFNEAFTAVMINLKNMKASPVCVDLPMDI